MTRFWDLRFRWSRIRLVKALRTGIHRFEPVEICRNAPDSDWLEKWSAIDSVFLKAISLSHGPTLHEAVSSRCFHLQGRGESKGAVRKLHAALATGHHLFVFRSGVFHYYESMNHSEILHALNRLLPNRPNASSLNPLRKPVPAGSPLATIPGKSPPTPAAGGAGPLEDYRLKPPRLVF